MPVAKKAPMSDDKKKIEELTKENTVLLNRILASEITITKLAEEHILSETNYLEDIKRLLLKLGGQIHIDAVTSAASRDVLLTVQIDVDKNGGFTYTLCKEKA